VDLNSEVLKYLKGLLEELLGLVLGLKMLELLDLMNSMQEKGTAGLLLVEMGRCLEQLYLKIKKLKAG
jgi:hypothetical protein